MSKNGFNKGLPSRKGFEARYIGARPPPSLNSGRDIPAASRHMPSSAGSPPGQLCNPPRSKWLRALKHGGPLGVQQ